MIGIEARAVDVVPERVARRRIVAHRFELCAGGDVRRTGHRDRPLCRRVFGTGRIDRISGDRVRSDIESGKSIIIRIRSVIERGDFIRAECALEQQHVVYLSVDIKIIETFAYVDARVDSPVSPAACDFFAIHVQSFRMCRRVIDSRYERPDARRRDRIGAVHLIKLPAIAAADLKQVPGAVRNDSCGFGDRIQIHPRRYSEACGGRIGKRYVVGRMAVEIAGLPELARSIRLAGAVPVGGPNTGSVRSRIVRSVALESVPADERLVEIQERIKISEISAYIKKKLA